MVPRHCILLYRVWCNNSGLRKKKLNCMRRTRWYRVQRLARAGGRRNHNWPMENHPVRDWRSMYTSLISSGLRKTKQSWRTWRRDTLHRVLQEHGGFIDRGYHVFHWCWETLRIAKTILDHGLMNGHSIVGWIWWFSHGQEGQFCQCLSMSLWSIWTWPRRRFKSGSPAGSRE